MAMAIRRTSRGFVCEGYPNISLLGSLFFPEITPGVISNLFFLPTMQPKQGRNCG